MTYGSTPNTAGSGCTENSKTLFHEATNEELGIEGTG